MNQGRENPRRRVVTAPARATGRHPARETGAESTHARAPVPGAFPHQPRRPPAEGCYGGALRPPARLSAAGRSFGTRPRGGDREGAPGAGKDQQQLLKTPPLPSQVSTAESGMTKPTPTRSASSRSRTRPRGRVPPGPIRRQSADPERGSVKMTLRDHSDLATTQGVPVPTPHNQKSTRNLFALSLSHPQAQPATDVTQSAALPGCGSHPQFPAADGSLFWICGGLFLTVRHAGLTAVTGKVCL